jgi:hypothetical protein
MGLHLRFDIGKRFADQVFGSDHILL